MEVAVSCPTNSEVFKEPPYLSLTIRLKNLECGVRKRKTDGTGDLTESAGDEGFALRTSTSTASVGYASLSSSRSRSARWEAHRWHLLPGAVVQAGVLSTLVDDGRPQGTGSL